MDYHVFESRALEAFYHNRERVTHNQTAMMFAGPPKSVGLAVLLACLFGPLGMPYVTLGGAFVMLLVGGMFSLVTMGAGILFVLPVCMLWAGSSASEHNQRRQVRAVTMLRP
jgi:hypothetical protein